MHEKICSIRRSLAVLLLAGTVTETLANPAEEPALLFEGASAYGQALADAPHEIASIQDPGWKNLALRDVEEVPVLLVHPTACIELLNQDHLSVPGSNSAALRELIAGRVRRSDKGGVDVDPGGLGEGWKTLAPNKPTVLEWFHGGRVPRLQFFVRDSRWWMCSANLSETTRGEPTLQLLDANADGDYLDPRDLIRFHDGVFRPLGADRWVDDGETAWAFRLELRRGKARVQYSAQVAHPEASNATQRKAYLTANRLRNQQGYAPAMYSPQISEALTRHTAYLHHHDPNKAGTLPSYFGEEVGRALYSVEGDSASRSGSVNYLTPGIDTVRHVTALLEMTHSRMTLFVPGRPHFGYGKTQAWSFLGTRPTDVETGADYWVLPGAGASGVPVTCGRNWPFPKSYPTLYDDPRGIPISIHIPDFKQVDGSYLSVRTLGAADAGTGVKVAGFFFGIQDIRPTAEPELWFFVPAKPLEPDTTFLAQAVLERRRGADGGPGILGEEEAVQWQFTTAK